MGFCQPSSYLCRRCPAAASAVRACVALISIKPIICGPILISSVSLPVAVLASAMCGIFCLRGPVLWLVSYVARPVCGYPVPSARSGQNRGNGQQQDFEGNQDKTSQHMKEELAFVF